ncbi:MAG: hypothetical protein KKB70_08240 [Proteobacteria bacterium]|nr:hypothetical protein [Pseudomonadota bacterium]MBU1611287.1 hypothetical protein [Pseudomonadota bacterium]
MHLTLQFDTDNIDWQTLADIYAKAKFEGRTPEVLQADFEAADVVCFGFDNTTLTAAVRILGGKMYDFCVKSHCLGYGPALVMYEYASKRAKVANPLIVAAEGVERQLIEKAELAEHLA